MKSFFLKLASLLTPSAGVLVSKIVSASAAFVSTVVVANYYGADVVGFIAVLSSGAMVTGLVATAGQHTFLVKMFSRASVETDQRQSQRRGYLHAFEIFFLFGFIGALVFTIFVTWLRPEHEFTLEVPTLVFCLFFVVARGLYLLGVEVSRALHPIWLFSILSASIPVLALVFLFGGRIIDSSDRLIPILATSVAAISVSLFAIYLNYHKIAGVDGGSRLSNVKIDIGKRFHESLKGGTAFLVPGLSAILLLEGSILVAATFLDSEELGIFAVAQKIAVVCAFVQTSVVSVLQPSIARYDNYDHSEAGRSIARQGAFLIFFGAFPIIVALWIFADFIINLCFAPQYQGAIKILQILLIGQLFNSMFAAIDPYLTMTKRQNILSRIVLASSFLALCSTALSLTFVSQDGNALAASIVAGQIFWRICSVIYIFRKEGWFFTFLSVFFYDRK